MSAYWQLTLAQLKLFIRNRQVIFWSLMFPIFFMVMLGSFFSNGNSISLSGQVIDQDNSAESQALLQAFTGQTALELKSADNEDKALDSLKKGDQQLVIIIPQGYGQALAVTSAATPNANGTAAQVVAYYDETNAALSQIGLTVVAQIVDGVSKQLTHYVPVVTVQNQGVQSLNLKYIDFLVPGIVAMMIMSNNLNGVAGQIASWRERGILRRMQSTPLAASTFIAAQITARLMLNGLQAVIVLLVGSLIFGTQVNGSWALLLLFVVLGTLAFMAIGFIIAGLAKTPESAGPIAGFISFPLLFLGGVFFPIKNMPEFLQPLIKLIPITHLTNALRQVMNVGADLTALWPEATILGGWLIVAFVVASFTFKWE
ncbi:MAG: transporter [Paenibacillaceae bacterium]|jgi:ABC-2 type transport system permease protein|nr:transporter [Paenibacillaceae bacterium]